MGGRNSESTDPGIRFVVFDMDGVLVRLDREKRNRCLSGFTGKTPEHFDATIWHSDFERRAEAGEFPTAAAYLSEFNRRSGCALSRTQWIASRRDAMVLIPETLEIARELSTTASIAVLTNNGALLKDSLPELAPELCLRFGDSFHVSCEFRSRKPDRQVFERLLTQHAMLPGEALLIDDDRANVEGAVEAGMRAVLFGNPGELRACLAAHGLAV